MADLDAIHEVDAWVQDASAGLVYSSTSRLACPSGLLVFESESEAPAAGEHVWQPSSRAAGSRERRAMVRACRALRVQIKGFEDDFRSAAGHAPRGGERLPLASTYRQYREWKRDIRDHAAAQIQALVRRRQRRSRARGRGRAAPGAAGAAPGPVAGPPGDGARVEAAKRREAVAQLSREKRHVKQQLKDYDAKFFKKHGRPPLKFEKEPIRDLYEAYHAIKARLAQCG